MFWESHFNDIQKIKTLPELLMVSTYIHFYVLPCTVRLSLY